MPLISTLPLEELCEMYQNAWILRHAKKMHPEHFCWTVEALEHDMQLLFEAMENKIPDSHQWDIESIKKGLTTPAHNIKPGNRYRHVDLPCSIALDLIIVQEEDGLWRCRQYINGTYANSVLIKTNTILHHYQLQP